MASLIAPIADSHDDAEAAPPVHAQALPDAVLIPPEGWLHAETVDELRAHRARIGLPVPRGMAAVHRPPMTSLNALLLAMVAPEQPGALRAGPRAASVLGPIVGMLVGLLAGIICALVASAAHIPIP
ncbi:MAG TPA: hypothetical protein VGP82_20740 [Ktedonobacterales bacterium]|nr:hypothetical protein [Ktedonobacterales bacterium]